MDERKIEILMREYGEGIEPSARVHLARPMPRRQPSKRILSAASIVVAVAAAVSVLGPRVALANALRKVGTAVTDVRTMRADTTVYRPSGPWPLIRAWYQDGKWRIESRRGAPLETLTIERDGIRTTTYKKFGDTLAEPITVGDTAAEPEGRRTALDFAKEWADLGWAGVPRRTSIEAHGDVGGKPTYEIVFSRDEGTYEARLLIDRTTNLPIRSEIRYSNDRLKGPERVVQDYTYGTAVAESMFVPPTPPIDRIAETSRWRRVWSRPIAVVEQRPHSIAILDVRRMMDGSIWVLTSSTETTSLLPSDRSMPSVLASEDGTTYLRATEQTPFGWSPSENRFGPLQLDGKQASVAVFVPLEPVGEWMGAIRLGFGKGGAPEKTERWVTLHPVEEDRKFPAYAAPLGLEWNYGRSADMNAAQMRAIAYKRRGRWADAYRWFMAAYKENLEVVPYRGHLYLTGAAQCLRKLGRLAEATRLEAQAAKIERSDPNAPNPNRDRFWTGD